MQVILGSAKNLLGATELYMSLAQSLLRNLAPASNMKMTKTQQKPNQELNQTYHS